MGQRRSKRRSQGGERHVARNATSSGSRGAAQATLLGLPGGIGNQATGQLLKSVAQGQPLPVLRDRQTFAPREAPAYTDATVKRAERMKRDVDRAQLGLQVAVRELSDVATPVIQDFRSNYAGAYPRVKKLVEPFAEDPDSNIGSAVSVTLNFATYFLPQARGLRAIGAALVTAFSTEGIAQLAGGADEASQKAARALQLSQWLSETRSAADAGRLAQQVVPSQYDAATDLMIAVGRPWVAKLDAQDAGDRQAEIRAASTFVAAAMTFLEQAPAAAESMRNLIASYKEAAADNAEDNEVRRMLAVITPDMLASRIPGWFGFQSDRRPEFIRKVLVPRLPGMSPVETAVPLSYMVTVRDLARRWFRLVAPRGTPAATIHFAGQTITMDRYRDTLRQLQGVVEEHQQRSVRSVVELSDDPGPSWIDDVRVGINTYRHADYIEMHQQALIAAATQGDLARRFWNKMAGIP